MKSNFSLYFLIAILGIFLVFYLERYNIMIEFMGVFFIVVAILKILDWKGFSKAFAMYDIAAARSKIYAKAYPLIELGLGLAYWFKWEIRFAAFLTLILMAVGAYGVAQNLTSKKPVKCACLGTLIKIPLTKFTLFEDLLMVAMALMILL